MQQLTLTEAPSAPLPRQIDLRCASIDTVLADLEGKGERHQPHLVVADPPWPRYAHQPGKVDPALQYDLLSYTDIAAHLERAAGVCRPRARLLLWVTWPLLTQWLTEPRSLWKTVPRKLWRPATGGAGFAPKLAAGAFYKDSATPGVGIHWLGDSEPVLVLVRVGRGRAYTNHEALVGNGYVTDREAHSRKPADWQARLISRWVPKGGLVLDLYAGLGSVAEAVLKAGDGRRYRGAEISPERYQRARDLIHYNTHFKL